MRDKNYCVQTYTLCDGWINAWCDDNGKPITYASEETALRELDEFIEDQWLSVDVGDMIELYSRDDYRVVEV